MVDRQFTKRIATFLFAVCMVATCQVAPGQTYPTRPVRLVSAFPPGGATDIIARLVSQHLGRALGQAVVVENKPGAGGAIGADAVAKAPADGYTLLIGGSGVFSTSPAFGNKVPFDSVRDFASIVELVETPRVLVVSSTLPYKSVKELIAAARLKPGALNYASNGIGGTVQMSSEAFKLVTEIDITHVPYKGTALALSDLASGQVAMLIDNIVSVQPSLQSGKARALAVTSSTRSALLPDVPTMIEAGVPGFVDMTYFGLFAPAGTPSPVIVKLNAEINKMLQLPEVIDQLVQQGAIPVGGTPQDFASHIAAETAKWTKVVTDAGITPN